MSSLRPEGLDEIEIKMKHAVEEILIEAKAGPRWSDCSYSARTSRIKDIVSEIGHGLSYSVCANSHDSSDDHEWRYDLMWFHTERDEDTDDDLVTDSVLAMEIEWGSWENILYDFEKLLVANTKYKVMVFERDDVEKTVERLAQRVLKFKNPTLQERYVFIAYDRNSDDFQFKCFQRNES